jgi:hypothetical protein
MSGQSQFRPHNDDHHRVAAKKKHHVKRGRPATSVHGFVLAVFRARAPTQQRGARARSIRQLYRSGMVNALVDVGQNHSNIQGWQINSPSRSGRSPALVLRIVLAIFSDLLRISLVDLCPIFDSRPFSIPDRENHLASWKLRLGSS